MAPHPKNEDDKEMKLSMAVNRFTCAVVGAAAVALLQLGCATGGNATASGADSTAKGGDASANVTLTSSIALGDKVATAAADFARTVMAGATGPITEAVQQEAIQKGVEEGVRVAKTEGKEVTEHHRTELTQFVTKQVLKARHAKK